MDKVSDMREDLSFERSKFEMQDRFYMEKLDMPTPERYDFNSVTGHIMQKKDIDLSFCGILHVSEKHRRKDYNDFLFEIYSVWNENTKTKGWSVTGESDLTVLFMPSSVYIFDTKQLHSFIEKVNINIPESTWRIFSEMGSMTDTINIMGDKMTMVKSLNRNYMTLSLAVPFDILKKHGINFKRYDM